MSARRTARRAACAVVLFSALGASCTNILGLDSDFNDAANALCVCTDILDSFKISQATCRDRLDGSLAKSTPDKQAGWLQVYQDNKCGLCTTSSVLRLQCLFARPVCAELGGDCTEPLDCCDYLNFTDLSGAKSACLPNAKGALKCQKCTAIGQPCNSSSECCGYPFITTNGYDPPYCDPKNHVCVTEQPMCFKTGGGPCTEDSECCGSEAGLGHCSSTGACQEECDPEHDDNCPNCCGQTSGIGVTYPFECLDGKDIGKCPSICRTNDDKCAAPTTCDSVCNSFKRCVALCQ